MAHMHPDEWYALVQEQHHDLLHEAAQSRLLPPRAAWHSWPVRPAIVHWAGAHLMSLGLRWQGYNSYAQPVLICGGTICQHPSAPLGDGEGCVSPV